MEKSYQDIYGNNFTDYSLKPKKSFLFGTKKNKNKHKPICTCNYWNDVESNSMTNMIEFNRDNQIGFLNDDNQTSNTIQQQSIPSGLLDNNSGYYSDRSSQLTNNAMVSNQLSFNEREYNFMNHIYQPGFYNQQAPLDSMNATSTNMAYNQLDYRSKQHQPQLNCNSQFQNHNHYQTQLPITSMNRQLTSSPMSQLPFNEVANYYEPLQHQPNCINRMLQNSQPCRVEEGMLDPPIHRQQHQHYQQMNALSNLISNNCTPNSSRYTPLYNQQNKSLSNNCSPIKYSRYPTQTIVNGTIQMLNNVPINYNSYQNSTSILSTYSPNLPLRQQLLHHSFADQKSLPVNNNCGGATNFPMEYANSQQLNELQNLIALRQRRWSDSNTRLTRTDNEYLRGKYNQFGQCQSMYIGANTSTSPNALQSKPTRPKVSFGPLMMYPIENELQFGDSVKSSKKDHSKLTTELLPLDTHLPLSMMDSALVCNII